MVRKILFLICLFIYCRIPQAGEKLVIISPHREGVKIEIGNAFKQWHKKRYHSDVHVEWIDQGGTSDDLRFVESLFRKTPEGIGIDLFFGGGVDPYVRLKEQLLLQPYKVPEEILKYIPRTCAGIPTYDKTYYWYGVVLSGFGIMYNKKVLDFLQLPCPAEWKDLGKPVYFSWVGAADPRHSGSMHMMYEIILQVYGWENGWETIFALAGNTKTFYSSASRTAKDTVIGEVAVSLCIDSYALSQMEINGSDNIGFVLPPGLTVINPDAIGILKGAPNLQTAKRFIDFSLSYKGQLLWMLKKGHKEGPSQQSLNRLSIRPDVYKHPDVLFKNTNPYLYSKKIRFRQSLASKRWALLNDMLGASVIDCHSNLKKTWEIHVRKKTQKHFMEIFCALPFEKSLQRFYWDNWQDPAFRNKYVTSWLNRSIEKFKTCEKNNGK